MKISVWTKNEKKRRKKNKELTDLHLEVIECITLGEVLIDVLSEQTGLEASDDTLEET